MIELRETPTDPRSGWEDGGMADLPDGVGTGLDDEIMGAQWRLWMAKMEENGSAQAAAGARGRGNGGDQGVDVARGDRHTAAVP